VKRREVERAPWWASSAAPTRWAVTASAIGAVAAWSLLAVSAPLWVILLGGPLAALVAELYWRRTRSPREDRPLSLLARLFYRRPNE
jgi:hypothetical protein